MKRRPRRQNGFTLLELILSSFIIALLMLSLYTALHTAYKARTVMNTASAKVRSARAALDLIEQDLRSVQPPSTVDVLAGPFEGTDSEIDFNCLARDYGKDADPLSDGMRYVSILMDSSTGTQALVQKVQRNLLPAAAADPVNEIIATNVTAFSVRYYDGTDWATEWDSTQENNTLPVAVEVTVTVQPSPTDPPFTLIRTVAIPCGVNVNNSSSTTDSTSGGSSTTVTP